MLAIAMGLLVAALPVSDSVNADLNSPIYAMREKARDILRASFVPTDRTKWNRLQATLAKLIRRPAAEVLAMASHDFNLRIDIVDIDDYYSASRTRLDRDWVLECWFEGGTLTYSHLRLEPPPVQPGPPPNYTGLWRIYLENGDLASSRYYMHGMPAGPLGDGTYERSIKIPADSDAEQ